MDNIKLTHERLLEILKPYIENFITRLKFNTDDQGYISNDQIDYLKNTLLVNYRKALDYDRDKAQRFRQALERLFDYGTDSFTEHMKIMLEYIDNRFKNIHTVMISVEAMTGI